MAHEKRKAKAKAKSEAKAKAAELKANKATPNKRVLIQCAVQVDKDAVSRRTVDGIEHIIVSSKTLPENIVMNGILYPADEVAASFHTLERTLAPIEHPTDSQGRFLPASDPISINNFHGGAHNENVRLENGRVHIDKVINVQEALKTDRGKRLLDRIEELETSESPRPVHTSVGVFIEIEELDAVQTNAMGQEFQQIARELVFDHDAILLGSVGAAQPHQGVGMAVNQHGDEIETQQIDGGIVDRELVTIPTTDITEMSFRQIADKLHEALNTPPLSADFVVDVFPSRVIYELGDQFFTVPYEVGNGVVSITGIPIPVDREVSFTPTTNQDTGDAMKELILNALSDAKIETEGLDDAQLFAKYNELQANQSNSESDDDAGKDEGKGKAADAEVVANASAIQSLSDQIAGLEAKLNKQDDDDLTKYATIVANSAMYAEIDLETAKLLPVDKLKSMAAKLVPSHGVPLTHVVNSSNSDRLDMTTELPA